MKSKQDGAELSDDILELFENSEELLYTDKKWLILWQNAANILQAKINIWSLFDGDCRTFSPEGDSETDLITEFNLGFADLNYKFAILVHFYCSLFKSETVKDSINRLPEK